MQPEFVDKIWSDNDLRRDKDVTQVVCASA